ncbi:hypothetical protein [Flavobacterium columnare]|uniref:hypothetical protein n=1 Tax=Flavobacterium columnare TaxID=996 RepID=UPI0013E3AE32|nr:hypothetical protein [Flavobacterium columnare]
MKQVKVFSKYIMEALCRSKVDNIYGKNVEVHMKISDIIRKGILFHLYDFLIIKIVETT